MNAQKTRIVPALMLAAALHLAGCAQQPGQTQVSPLCAPPSHKLQLMQTAELVLADMYFSIDKADPNIGLIQTRALTGAQFFEFWRSDNIGPANALEANIQTITRIARLNLNEQDSTLCLTCSVRTYRLNMPEHEVSSSGRAYTMFTKSSSSLQRIKLNPEQKAHLAWTDLGEDTLLAAEILRRIEERIAAVNKEQTI